MLTLFHGERLLPTFPVPHVGNICYVGTTPLIWCRYVTVVGARSTCDLPVTRWTTRCWRVIAPLRLRDLVILLRLLFAPADRPTATDPVRCLVALVDGNTPYDVAGPFPGPFARSAYLLITVTRYEFVNIYVVDVTVVGGVYRTLLLTLPRLLVLLTFTRLRYPTIPV